MSTCDLLVRGGTIVDGSGGEPFVGDVAIHDGKIVSVGTFTGEAREVIDATGLTVTPGFVDIHTHYDGQAIWSEELSPLLLPWRDHGRDRQLRRGLRALPRC